MVKCHPGFWGGIFSNFGERMERLQIAVDGYCFSQRLYSIPCLACLIIFFNKKH